MKSLTVAPYWFTVGVCKTSGHRKLRCHRNLRWRYTLDAGRRSSSTKDRTRYRYTLRHIATL
ncbi:hypothetical protein HanXRQr2_Chr11g0495651 [Helianthus annuus]|uniref:Uncharacterized protein n=1 Tax=Helianthus annuus TaxID=4232 RepID=A0A9K3N0C6_HELAN|nr:hypothetical protein HanXRQr2_Chr11g0495651 [Helianthus annuus]KAJ0875543.1 hypothetical protein HanPSC8_Chr11g0477651 [Helianthus annuus]